MAIILSGLTIFACLILGLPVRLNKKLNYWWTTNYYIPIIGAIVGLTLLFLALLPTFSDTVTCDLDGEPTLKQIPNSIFSITGWLLTAFSILHIYSPPQLKEKLKTIFQNTFKTSLTIVLTFSFFTGCNSSTNRTAKTPLLKADREAPLGWVYLTINRDSTFEFKLTGIRGDGNVYKGKVEIEKDSLFFAYSDSVPGAGKTAVYNEKVVAYINGEYPERLNISMTKLTK